MASLRFKLSSSDLIDGELVNAHLLSRDNQVVPGSISLSDNSIEVKTSSENNVAISLLFDAGKSGRLMLQTGILPPREEPYMLVQELVRHRIKLFLDMCENWSLFYLSDDHPAVQKWEESRLIFTDSLVAPSDEEATALARKALEQAISATERLALAHAQLLLHKRYAKKPASSSAFGVGVNPSRFDEPLRNFLSNNVDIVSLPMQWSDLEPSAGQYQWEQTDQWVKWIQQNGKHAIAGPIIDFATKDAIPSWVREQSFDFPSMRDLCYNHLEQVVTRYGGAISFWNVVSGINLNMHISLNLNHMVDLIRTAALVVRQKRRDAKVMIEIAHPFSEFVTTEANACNTSVLLARLAQEGVRLDAVGVQLLVGKDSGRRVRDLMLLSSKLDEFLHAEIPVIVSKLGAPSETISQSDGWWKVGWDERTQEKWAEHMFAIALSKPFVNSVIWADLYDHQSMDIPSSGFLTEKGKPRALMSKLVKMRKRLKKPLGALELPNRTQEHGA